MNVAREKKYFGTDGIRGVAGAQPLDPESLVRLGRAIAAQFIGVNGRHRVLIGKDTRLSGYMIENALAAGLTSAGCDVLICGPLPTPGVSYLTRSMRADAGVMISASHNPYEDNGIKIFGPDGLKLADEKEALIEEMLDAPEMVNKVHAASGIGRALRVEDAVGRYTVFLKEGFPRELSLEGLKVGFDGANGAAYLVGPQVLEELGADVVSRGISPNGKNINAGFGSLYPEVVAKLVAEQHLALGISLDGDADRCILVDEQGQVLDGDMILAILALDMKHRGVLDNDTVVSTVMSNLGLVHYLKRNGIKLVQTQVGDRYVLEEMLKGGYQLGGEQSGHTIIPSISPTGDGLLTALAVLSVMLRRNLPLSELIADYRKFPQKLLSLPVNQKLPLDSIPAINEKITQCEQELGDTGRVLVRYSGTEDKVRIMVECEDEESCKRYVTEIASVIERELGAV